MKITYLPHGTRFACDDRMELILSQIYAALDLEIIEWEKIS